MSVGIEIRVRKVGIWTRDGWVYGLGMFRDGSMD